MKSVAKGINSALGQFAQDDELARKTLRAQKVKDMWRHVVEPVFLDHTNAVYIIRDQDRKVLIVYVDDSLFASELNARRELIKLKLHHQYGEDIDEFQIKISYGKMKHTYAFRKEVLDPFYSHKAPSIPLSFEKRQELEELVSSIPDKNVRTALLQAMIDDLEWKSGIEFENSNNLLF